MKDNYKLCVVTAQKFPSGLASNNRILSYCKGLAELNYQVDVLTITNSDEKNGNISAVNFFNLGPNLGNKFGVILIGIFNLSALLFKNNYKYLILVSNNALLIIVLFCICKLKKISFIQEKSEFPFVLNYKGLIKEKMATLYVKYIYKLFDGMIIMTQPLLDYFNNKTKDGCKLFLMPMTVDVTRFLNIEKSDKYSNCITYCGYMGGNKDGVKNLIEAFSFIKEKHPNIQLLLLGSANATELNEIIDYANRLAPNRVIFEGQVSRQKIPFYLKNSKILALARPQSLQSLGGFPTKLGEYLSTKKPVIVTAVGDIPKYLKNRKNAFVVEPDNNHLFAEELSFIIDNYNSALEIASQGYNLTLNVFNYKQQAINLDRFLKTF